MKASNRNFSYRRKSQTSWRLAGLRALPWLAWMVAGCGAPGTKVPAAGTEHLPLRHKLIYAYEQRADGETTRFTMSMQFIGGESTKVFRVKFDGLDLGECVFLQKGTAVIFETTKPLTRLEDPRLVAAYRQLWVEETASRGETWEDGDTGTRTLFAGFESVTVPAGTYSDCYKTVTETLPAVADTLRARLARGEISQAEFERSLRDSEYTVVRWFAPGVGLVKEQIGSPEFVRELRAIQSPGDNG